MIFNKETQIQSFKTIVEKLIPYLKTKGIEFVPDDGLENVVFKSKENILKIAHNCFYRYSGIACIYKDGQEKNSIEAVVVTDAMFIDIFIKPAVETYFKN
jgi:hypothetical protein